jgi:ABC-2 type transport system permease protein
MRSRIAALVKRNLTITYRGIDPFYDILYWPLYDLLLWGFASRGVETVGKPHLSLVWLSSLVLWQACVRANLDLSLNFLGELWSHNVVTLFASPLKLREWILAAMILGALNSVLVVMFGSLFAYLLYGVNILALGWIIIPLFFLLLHSGWVIGFFATGCVMYGGLKVQKIVWILGWVFAPFSALFYALQVLPLWAYAIAKSVPMSYAIEGLRSYALTGVFPTSYLVTSFLLNCLYSVLTLYFLLAMFQKSKRRGLAQLEMV